MIFAPTNAQSGRSAGSGVLATLSSCRFDPHFKGRELHGARDLRHGLRLGDYTHRGVLGRAREPSAYPRLTFGNAQAAPRARASTLAPSSLDDS